MDHFVTSFIPPPRTGSFKPESDQKNFKTSTMNVIQWYAISLAGVLAVFFICQASLYAPSFYIFVLFYLSKYIASPLLIQRRYWTSVTGIQAIVLLAYV